MTKIGLWLELPEPLVVECAARAKPDWIGLDLQHGGWDLGTAFRGIQLIDALGIPVLVRVSEQELGIMARLLDHGASGIVVAMSSGVELVEEAVRRARYQPEGVRSFGGQRYGLRRPLPKTSEVRPPIYPMIEDRRGFEDVAAIAKVPRIAGLHIGPVDLGLGLGLEQKSPAFADALKSIVKAGHDAGVPVVMHAVHGAEIAGYRDFNFDEFVLTADIELIRDSLRGEVEEARQSCPGL